MEDLAIEASQIKEDIKQEPSDILEVSVQDDQIFHNFEDDNVKEEDTESKIELSNLKILLILNVQSICSESL